MIRLRRTDLSPSRDDFGTALPDVESTLAVYLHGLGENEKSWRLHADRQGDDGEAAYGLRLADHPRYTPVHLRHNTGLHIFENGLNVADLLEKVVCAWPIPVSELLLIGHSMGGLVI